MSTNGADGAASTSPGATGSPQVSSFLVKRLRAQHGTLGHALPPLQVRGGRDRTQVAELDGRDRRLEIRSDRLPDRRLTCAARPDSRSNIASIFAVLATDLTP
jgi:hypothetical protein